MDQVERLCEVLGEETRLCTELASVLRAEQQAVVQLKPNEILFFLEQRQLLQEEMTRLADERRSLVREVAAERGAATERATEVLPLLAPEPQAQVRLGVRRLRQALLDARGLERQTALLLDGSLGHVTEILRQLRALVPGATYGADAQVAVPYGGPNEGLSQRV